MDVLAALDVLGHRPKPAEEQNATLDLSNTLLGLREMDLRGVNLQGANLRNANLQKARLHGADLRDADLSDADMMGAKLHGTHLSGTRLCRADLSEVEAQDALGLTKAQWDSARDRAGAKPPPRPQKAAVAPGTKPDNCKP